MSTGIQIKITNTVQLNRSNLSWSSTYQSPESLERIYWWISNIFVPNTTEIDNTLRGLSGTLTSSIIADVVNSISYADFQQKLISSVNHTLLDMERGSNTSNNRVNAFQLLSFVKLILKYVSLATPWGITDSNLISPSQWSDWETRVYNILVGPDPVTN